MKRKLYYARTIALLMIIALAIVTTLPAVSNAEAVTGGGKVNINSANADEMARLPGIGVAKANAIITYRGEYGPFHKPEDLMKVRGVGNSIFEKIRELVIVN